MHIFTPLVVHLIDLKQMLWGCLAFLQLLYINGSVNYGQQPAAKSIFPKSAFVNKVLLEPSHIYLFMPCPWFVSNSSKQSEIVFIDKHCLAHKIMTIYSRDFYRTSLLPCLLQYECSEINT